MLIVGSGGFAKELLQVFSDRYENSSEGIAFFDDVNLDRKLLYNEYPILNSFNSVSTFFSESKSDKYAIGIGNPKNRKFICDKFKDIGGTLVSLISPHAKISRHVEIGTGASILSGCSISNSVTIGVCVLVYYNAVVTHDCNIGNFVELSPGATLLGGVTVGNFSHIGSNATILPNIRIGENVIVGAGAVVTKDVPDNCIVTGIPATIKRRNKI
ncbi:acetyltransferase [Niabella aurantiaca]|uniref:acetyltransferase n=1 Tax=Niabella aurantiaca TaxID=379900 RepID=UPI00036162CD|nr:acetyltransferase [Niabella aurantiaca]